MKNWFQKYLPITFDIKLFLFLVLGFIVATVVGTMSFAFGYFLVGEMQGHDVRIFYQGADFLDDRPGSFLLSISGMLTPILIGIFGVILLIFNRRKFEVEKLSFQLWLLIFLSLFIMRQLDNFSFGILRFLATGKLHFPCAETNLAYRLNLPGQSIQFFMVIVGLIVLSIVIFKFIPKAQRLTFIIAGIVGGASGFYLWLIEFGKKILP